MLYTVLCFQPNYLQIHESTQLLIFTQVAYFHIASTAGNTEYWCSFRATGPHKPGTEESICLALEAPHFPHSLNKIRCSPSTESTQTQCRVCVYTLHRRAMCVLILEMWAGERTCHTRKGCMQCVRAADADSSRDVLQAEKAQTSLESRRLPAAPGPPLPWGAVLLHMHSLTLLPAVVISLQTQGTEKP